MRETDRKRRRETVVDEILVGNKNGRTNVMCLMGVIVNVNMWCDKMCYATHDASRMMC